jgi:Flp pilus assembly protein TadG
MSIIQNNRGATLVFVALSLLLLLLFLGLVIDTGWMVYVRAQGQKRVDAAALAAASALVEQNPANRRKQATRLANTFSDQNTVINASTDPANVVDPMKYDLTTGALTNLKSDWTPGVAGDNCNAVKIATTVPTPLFFSGVRNSFGDSETGSTDINVNAVAHLPCPGVGYLSKGGFAPIALRQCQFDTASDCERSQSFLDISLNIDISAFTTYNLSANFCSDLVNGIIPATADAAVEIGETINLIGLDQLPVCLQALLDHFRYCTVGNKCADPPDPRCTVRVPIVDQCIGLGSGNVVGFATICLNRITLVPIILQASLECNEYAGNTDGAGGVCLGTYTRSPILVQ